MDPFSTPRTLRRESRSIYDWRNSGRAFTGPRYAPPTRSTTFDDHPIDEPEIHSDFKQKLALLKRTNTSAWSAPTPPPPPDRKSVV